MPRCGIYNSFFCQALHSRILELMTVVIAGENAFVRQQELTRRVHAFTKQHGELAVERVDGEEVSMAEIVQRLQETSLFAPQRLVVLTNPSSHKVFQEDAEGLLASVPETTDVIVVETKPDKRTSYYKLLKKLGEFVEASPLDANTLATWAVSYAREQGGKLSRGDAQYLVDRTAADQRRLASELDKLLLAGETITRQTIDELTDRAPQGKIFDLLDAAFTGNSQRAMELYDEQRAQRVEPQEILAMIAWQLRQLALAKFAGTHDLIKEGKLSSYGARKAETAARRMSADELKRAVSRLAEIDARSKRTPLDVDSAVRAYLLGLASR